MKQYFKHALPTDDIVIRQDIGSDEEFFEKNVGQLYPLIKIKEQTINFSEIVSFSLNSGVNSILPQLNITIDDAEFSFRESNFIQKGDVLTIWIGNGQDSEHEVIKNNYYILDVSSSPRSTMVSFTCVLNVPELWNAINRSFELSSVALLKEIAKECQLGFVSNIEEGNDEMVWIQSTNNYSFITHIVERSFISEDSMIVVFIDQFANLNVMDIKTAIDDNTKIMLSTMPITGKKLDKPVPLFASNTTEGTDDPKAQIISWTPITQYGLDSIKYTAQVESATINPITHELIENSTPILSPQLKKSSLFTTFNNEWTHKNYGLSKASNINNKQLLGLIKLDAILDYYIPILYIGMPLPVEIWNIPKNEEIHSQNQALDEVEVEKEPAANENNKITKNLQMSGDTILLNLTIGYNRKSSTKAETKFVRQSITVMKKDDLDT